MSATIAMNPGRRLVLFLLACIQLAGVPLRAFGAPDEDPAIQSTLRQFFSAYTKKNVGECMALWSIHSPDYATQKKALEDSFAAYERLDVTNLVTGPVHLADGVAVVWVRMELTGATRSNPSGVTDATGQIFHLVSEDGHWKLWRNLLVAMSLADSLNALPSAQDRRKFLDDNREWLSFQLVQTIGAAGDQRFKAGKPDEAARLVALACEAADAIGDGKSRGACFFYRGYLALQGSRTETASASFQSALSAFRSVGDRGREADTLNAIAGIHLQAGESAYAVKAFEDVRQVYRQIGSRQGEAQALANVANVDKRMGRYEDAMAALREAKGLAQDLNLPELEGNILHLTGQVLQSLARYGEAEKALKDSVESVHKSNLRTLEANYENDLGIFYSETGNYGEALKLNQAALALAREIGDHADETSALLGMGGIHERLGDFESGLRDVVEAARLAHGLNRPDLELPALVGQGSIYLNLHKPLQAVTEFAAALPMAKVMGSIPAQESILSSLGIIYFQMQMFEQALIVFQQARDLAQKNGNRAGQSEMLLNIALCYQLLNRDKDELDAVAEGMKLAEAVGNSANLIHYYQHEGSRYRAHQDWENAAIFYGKAIALLEQGRASIPGPELQISFAAVDSDPYYGLVTAQASLHQDEAALQTAERTKARTLVEMMRGGGVRLSESMTDPERAREQNLNASVTESGLRYRAAQSRVGAQPDELEKIRKAVDDAHAAYDSFHQELYTHHPELAIHEAAGRVVALAELAPVMKGRNVAFLEYEIGIQDSYVFVIRPPADGVSVPTLTVHRLPALRSEVTDTVLDFRDAITKQQDDLQLTRLGNKLYMMLIAPAAEDLTGITELGIVPDGVLWELPFAAIPDTERKHMIEDYALFYAPSLTSLKAMLEEGVGQRSGQRTLLALAPFSYRAAGEASRAGYSTLPASGDEVSSICKMFDQSDCFQREAATESRVKLSGDRYHILHFATHGIYDAANPMYSGIVLSAGDKEDGLWSANEIANSKLNADLVVMSACETALGEVRPGEGILGLSWALFAAGSRSSLLSQWQVDDRSTTQLMKGFYQRIQTAAGSGNWALLGRAEALRKAQLELASSKQWAHPYFWSSFVLIGDWQ